MLHLCIKWFGNLYTLAYFVGNNVFSYYLIFGIEVFSYMALFKQWAITWIENLTWHNYFYYYGLWEILKYNKKQRKTIRNYEKQW